MATPSIGGTATGTRVSTRLPSSASDAARQRVRSLLIAGSEALANRPHLAAVGRELDTLSDEAFVEFVESLDEATLALWLREVERADTPDSGLSHGERQDLFVRFARTLDTDSLARIERELSVSAGEELAAARERFEPAAGGASSFASPPLVIAADRPAALKAAPVGSAPSSESDSAQRRSTPGATSEQPASEAIPNAESGAFVGDDSVSPEWLAERNRLMDSLRDHYGSALAAAREDVGGPGWTSTPRLDERGEPVRRAAGLRTPDGTILPMVRVEGDRPTDGPTYRWPEVPRAGGNHEEMPRGYERVYETVMDERFDEARFRAVYAGEPNVPLEALAEHFGLSSAAELLATHPELPDIALAADRAEYAGPSLEGQALLPPEALIMLDIALSDLDVQALVAADIDPVPPPADAAARAQLHLHGPTRYDAMVRYDRAMERVRGDYLSELGRARRAGAGPGWRTITHPNPMSLAPDDRAAYPRREFSVDRFTEDYVTRDTPSARLFADFHGRSATSRSTDHKTGIVESITRFDAPGWTLASGEGLRHDELASVALDDLPDLHVEEALFFVPGVGWTTPHGNIDRGRDWLGDVTRMVIVGGLTYLTAGAASGFAAGAFGAGTWTATLSGAALTGMASSVYSGVFNGGLTWESFFRSTLASTVTAGLARLPPLQALGASAPGAVTVRMVTQGSAAEILGGNFSDGALAGLAAGVADEMLASMFADIDSSNLGDTEKLLARQSARLVSSAVRVAYTDGHPAQAIAADYLNTLVQAGLDPAFDAAYDAGFDLGERAVGSETETAGVPGSENGEAGSGIELAAGGDWELGDDGREYRVIVDGNETFVLVRDGNTLTLRDDTGRVLSESQIDPSQVPVDGAGGLTGLPLIWQLPSGRRILASVGNGAAGAARLLVISPAGAVLHFLLIPGNGLDSGRYVITGNEHYRFLSVPEDERSGTLQRREGDEWVDVGGITRFEALSEEELALLAPPAPGRPAEPTDSDSPPPFTEAEDGTEIGPDGLPIDEEANGPTAMPGADPDEQLPTAEDLTLDSRATRELRNNLLTAGEPPPTSDSQAHHIVPWNDSRAADLRQLLDEYGIDINSAENGVWLPRNESASNPTGAQPHNETMRNSYFEELRRRFRQASSGPEIQMILDMIKTDLKNGNLVLPRT